MVTSSILIAELVLTEDIVSWQLILPLENTNFITNGRQKSRAPGLVYMLGMEFLDKLKEANKIRQKEWDTGGNVTLAYRGNELAGEVGEACNLIKKLERERFGMVGSRTSVEHLAEELADVLICLSLISIEIDVDLVEATAAKFNKTSEKYGLKTRI